MSKRRPFMKFYVSDWDGSNDVQCMSPEAEACYFTLIRKAWQSDDGGIPDDDELIKRLLGKFSIWWDSSAQSVRPKFEARAGKLYNSRLVQEINHMKAVQQKKKKAAGKRWKNASAMHMHMHMQSICNATQTNTKYTPPPPKGQGGGCSGAEIQPKSDRPWDGYL